MVNLRVVVSVALLAITGALTVEALSLSGFAGRYPQVLFGAVVIGLVAVLVQEARTKRRLADTDAELAGLWPDETRVRGNLLGFVAVWLAYPLLLAAAGFILATVLAMTASFWVAGFRRVLLGLVVSVIFTLCLAVLLKTMLYVPMPLGAADLALERFLYLMRN